MTDLEARQIIGRLTSSYPQARLGADNIAAYMSWVTKHDFSVAEAAVVQVVGSLKRWPTLADFDEACRDVLAARRLNRELEESPREWRALSAAEKENGKVKVAEALEALRKAHRMPYVGNRKKT